MAGSLNKVFLIGNLTKDPEVSQAGSSSVCKFGIAVNRKFKQGDEWKTEVTFINIIVWGKSGENCAKYLTKGKSAMIEGRLVIRSYDKDGEKKYVTEVVADNCQFLSGANERGESAQSDNPLAAEGFTSEPDDSSSIPF